MKEPVDLERLLAELEQLKANPLVAPDYVEFRQGLLRSQGEILASLPPPPPPSSLPLTGADLVVEPAAALSLAEWFQVVADDPEGDFALLHRWGQEEPDRLVEMARRAACAPDQEWLAARADQLGVNLLSSLFLGRALAAPYLHQLVFAWSEAGAGPPEESREGACPACSSPDALALLVGEEGWKKLCCSLCGHQWRHPRLQCAHCGNTDQESLGRLAVADTDPAWVEVCDRCHGYTKTVSLRDPQASPLALVQEVATLHLDLMAEKGNSRVRLPYVALI